MIIADHLRLPDSDLSDLPEIVVAATADLANAIADQLATSAELLAEFQAVNNSA